MDRLLDEDHAALVGRIAAALGCLTWEVHPEVTYSVYSERGAIDVLAFQRAAATLLVVEVKTDLVSVEETLRRHDAKSRLAMAVAKDQLGWKGESVARLWSCRKAPPSAGGSSGTTRCQVGVIRRAEKRFAGGFASRVGPYPA